MARLSRGDRVTSQDDDCRIHDAYIDTQYDDYVRIAISSARVLSQQQRSAHEEDPY